MVYDPRITLPGSVDPEQKPPPKRARSLAITHDGKRIPLVLGDLLLGRAPTCHVVIDELMVSRVHAKIVITEEAIVIRDMNSTNGVFVNASRVDRPTPLREGDVISIGPAELTIVGVADTPQPLPAAPKREAAPTASDRTRKADAFEQLGAIADRLLAAGRIEMAEHALVGHLRHVLEGARDGERVPPATLAVACSYALKFAEAKNDGKWFDYVIELHSLLKRPLEAALTDRVSILARRRLGFDRQLFAKYQASLRNDERGMSLPDRVLCARILAIDPAR